MGCKQCHTCALCWGNADPESCQEAQDGSHGKGQEDLPGGLGPPEQGSALQLTTSILLQSASFRSPFQTLFRSHGEVLWIFNLCLDTVLLRPPTG